MVDFPFFYIYIYYKLIVCFPQDISLFSGEKKPFDGKKAKGRATEFPCVAKEFKQRYPLSSRLKYLNVHLESA